MCAETERQRGREGKKKGREQETERTCVVEGEESNQRERRRGQEESLECMRETDQ